MVAEPVQGAGGVIVPSEGYFQAIQPILRAHGIPLISDEDERDRVSSREVLAAVPEVPAIAEIQTRLEAKSDGQRAAAVELALEALYLAKRIDKVSSEGETVYG